ncbi:hypothetical protein H4219_006325, partial [Mycoemilia scoparia]
MTITIFRKKATLQEARNLEYVQDKISCPKLIRHYPGTDAGNSQCHWIEMELIKGKTLYEIWPELGEQQKQIVANNVKAEIKKLHSIPVDRSWIGNSCSGKAKTFIPDPLFGKIGFTNYRDFNDHIASK